MHLPNFKGWLAVLFIVITLAIPFAITYYVSTPTYKNRYKGWPDNSEVQNLPSRSKAKTDQVLLLKNEKLIIHRTAIVFKGLNDKKATIDLYLLDLDPEIPYTLNFSQKAMNDGIRLGNVTYRLISVNDTVLRLKIQDVHHTR